jgi:hypothetical protein
LSRLREYSNAKTRNMYAKSHEKHQSENALRTAMQHSLSNEMRGREISQDHSASYSNFGMLRRVRSNSASIDISSNIIDHDLVRLSKTNRILSKLAPALGLKLEQTEVRVDEEARQRNKAQGTDGLMKRGKIYLHPDTYKPDTAASKALLCHEAAHAVQCQKGSARLNSLIPYDNMAEMEARATGRAFADGRTLQPIRQQLSSREIEMGGHNRLERAGLETFIPIRLAGLEAGGGLPVGNYEIMPGAISNVYTESINEEEVIRLHDSIFNVMVTSNPWRGYNKETVRMASLGGALFESLARTPLESWGDTITELQSEEEASIGMFQAYPQFTARALVNPALRRWMLQHGDPAAQDFIQSLHHFIRSLHAGGELPPEERPTMVPYNLPQTPIIEGRIPESVIRGRLRGTNSPIFNSIYLSMAGKIQHTLYAIMELDRANPVMRLLPPPQQLRIWMDYETDDCDNAYYARGDFQREHLERGTGEPIDLRSYGSSQRHVMAHLGFDVWQEDSIPNPPR